MIPGFTINVLNTDITWRDGVKRVTGTAIDPIELGVVAGNVLPLASLPADVRQGPKGVEALASGALHLVRGSNNGVALCDISLAFAFGLFLVFFRQRVGAVIAALPVVIAGVFAVAHGLVSTIGKYFTLGSSDPSITHRTNNYAYVEDLVHQAPWFGTGGGTYIPTTVHILDNQYLTTTIELGLVVSAVVVLLLPSLCGCSRGANRTHDPELRTLCGALAGAGAGGGRLFWHVRLSFLSHVRVRGRVDPGVIRCLLAACHKVAGCWPAPAYSNGSRVGLDQRQGGLN